MNSCGYYSCFKGKPVCKHPEKGALWMEMYGKKLHQRCVCCRVQNCGLYPSALPREDFTAITFDVVDKAGRIVG